ncbi:MAG TPA: PilZ domain-containing protein [Tepidisphaeraceae bacterium]|nr:PilZ domain-containing protein [Tepidisphaeraceae bacterium]
MAEPTETTTPQRRREERVPCTAKIEVLPCRLAKEWKFTEGQMIDCSGEGIGFQTGATLSRGEQFLVKIQIDKTRYLLYTTQFASSQGKSMRVGGEYTGVVAAPMKLTSEILVAAFTAAKT